MAEEQQRKRRALVTGATGYVGSNLAKRLVAEGWDVHVIVRPTSGLHILDSIRPSITIHKFAGSTESMIELVAKARPDVVFHLASLFLSQHRPQDVEALISSNVLFSTQLVEALVAYGIPNLINAGTAWQQYGDFPYSPVNLYAATKQAFEVIITYYVEAHNAKVITLRIYDTYGPGDPRPKLLNQLMQSANKSTRLAMSPGDQYIDLVYIDDLIDALMIATELIDSQTEGHVLYGISSGEPVTLRQLVSIFEEATGIRPNVDWAVRPYRPREVMFPPKPIGHLPKWAPKYKLKTGIRKLYNENV